MADTPPNFAPPARPQPADVGSAYMEADGTIEMRLRTETDDGTVGEALLVIPPNDPRHAAMVKHLEGIRPGEGRAIKPFPEEPA